MDAMIQQVDSNVKMKIVRSFEYMDLDEQAKDKVRAWIYQDGFFWDQEAYESVKEFCARFDIKLRSVYVAPFDRVSYEAKIENRNFRNLRLRDFNRDHMPTGYSLDCDLWETFFDHFKRTGSAKLAFEYALMKGLTSWRADQESSLEDEYIADHCAANEYLFEEDGSIWRDENKIEQELPTPLWRNVERAYKAQRAIDAHIGNEVPDAIEAEIVDLITNLCHLADQHGLRASGLLITAKNHWENEREVFEL